MKRMGFIVAILTAGVLAFCIGYFYLLPENSDSLALSSLPTSIRIERDTLALGTVKYGEKRTAAFRLLNTGGEPLLIRDVKPSCGCTNVKWSKKPVCPGELTEISIVFEPNSLGRFMKSIDVWCNTTQQIHKLNLRGEVVE